MIQQVIIFQIQQPEPENEETWLAEMADAEAKESFWAQKSERLESRNLDEPKPVQKELPAHTENKEVT